MVTKGEKDGRIGILKNGKRKKKFLNIKLIFQTFMFSLVSGD